MFIELMIPSNYLIFCRPVPFLPSIFPSIRVFSNELALCIRWPKYWSFSISLSNEHLGLISFRIDWLDLLAVQGTLKSLLQHHSSKASIIWCSAFFVVQLSHPYLCTGKTIALTMFLKVLKSFKISKTTVVFIRCYCSVWNKIGDFYCFLICFLFIDWLIDLLLRSVLLVEKCCVLTKRPCLHLGF